MMPTNPTLPTFEQILKDVKARDWGHEWSVELPSEKHTCLRCGGVRYPNALEVTTGVRIGEFAPCPVRIAQAIRKRMVEALRPAALTVLAQPTTRGAYQELKEAADALEKECAPTTTASLTPPAQP